MRNLLVFFSKYNAFFLFLSFEILSIVIYINYNSFQKASFINSSNEITGNLYSRINDFYSYISLREVNDSLATENARLRNKLKSSFYVDTIAKHKVNDTVFKQQYEYVVARVVNNSINKVNNYITINKGAKYGITKGMGVICSSGIVGKVVNVSEDFSIIQSLLHKDSQFSAMLADNKEIGYVEWGEDFDPHKAVLKEVSNNALPKVGEAVVTSGFSLFPAGMSIGKISNLHTKTGGYALNMEVALSVDFGNLQYVNVVINRKAKQQMELEAQQKKNE